MPPSPSSPSAPPPEDDAPEVYDFSSPEEVQARKRRRLLIICLAALPLLLAGGWFGGRPVVRAIKAWQARRIAAQAEILTDAESWREALTKVQDACQLRITEPAVMRAAARYLTRVGNAKDARDFWIQLEAVRPLTAPEERDYATDELALGNLDAADARLHRAWPPGAEGTPEDWRVGLQIAARRRLNSETFRLARKILNSPASTDRLRLQGAGVLLSSGAAEDQSSAWSWIQKLAAQGKSAESLEALVIVARQIGAALSAAASHPESPAPKPQGSAADVAARLEAHPLAKAQHRLLALDLRSTEEPGKRAEIIDGAVERFAQGDNEDLEALCAWLYSKSEFERVLKVLPEDKAVTHRALYLQYLDTLGALGRWPEIEDLIKRQRFTLDPMTEQMYLARCSQQQGQPQARDVHWNAAVDAAGKSVERLSAVGNYAVRNGALAPAEVAFCRAIAEDPASRPAYNALLELYQSESRTSSLHDLLVAMSARWPDEDAVQNDAIYTGLLLGMDPAAGRAAARELVRKTPASLPHRVTLALAELRLGHALTALDAFDGIDVVATANQPRQTAVYAAALWETNNEPEARRIAAKLPADHLLPEEWALLQPIK